MARAYIKEDNRNKSAKVENPLSLDILSRWGKQNFLIKSLSVIAFALLLYGFWPWSFVILILMLISTSYSKKKN